jgi:hypothetical protein
LLAIDCFSQARADKKIINPKARAIFRQSVRRDAFQMKMNKLDVIEIFRAIDNLAQKPKRDC